LTDANGNIYVGGRFTNGNGKKYIAKWDGNSWTKLGGINSSTFNSNIYSLVNDINNSIYAGGGFTNGNGNYYVSKWDGSKWSELGGSNNSLFDGVIRTLLSDKNGNLFIGGNFSNDSSNFYIAKWDGSSWSELGGSNNSTFFGQINTLSKDINGNLYTAGYFTLNKVGYTTYYVAKYSSTTTPLTLTSFTAQASETNQIKTSWQTATEINTSHFIVEQSSDGKTFTAKGTVKAVGSGANSYTFDVPLFLNTPSGDMGGLGVRFFRLKMIDKDGSFTYSKVVSVSLTTNNSPLITINPNPAKDYTTISFSNSVQKATISVYDITGKTVIKQSIQSNENSVRLNTSNLTKGAYIIEVITDKGSIKEKLIVSK
jgi:hypothetical protein